MSLSVRIDHDWPGFSLSVDVTAPPGVTALFGASGAGKTTLIRAIAGLLRPDRGRIAVDGRVLFDSDRGVNLPPHRRRVGYVFQDARLFPHLSVRQNLLYGRWFSGAGGGPTLAQIADLLGIAPLLERRPAALSGGEAQRVALGRALLARPGILLLDEPLAALDQPRKAEILPYLRALRDATDLPIIHVSHDAHEIRALATTVLRLEGGRVIAQGPPDTVLPLPQDAGVTLQATPRDGPGPGQWVDTAAGVLHVATRATGPLRLRIAADQVMVATAPPAGLLGATILPAQVVGQADGLLRLAVGTTHLLARAPLDRALCPPPGCAVHAVLLRDPTVLDATGRTTDGPSQTG
ncbi:MAG: molybdenum ABC transporter ATP-binding protein [Paracoccus hibiscisoli]|uniref:molybdenum ABC transporter ATP-binding protein n=1 Tax=Paracoccus hibiscisoli TaxID=2023261 RepID=UPI003918B00A